MKKVLSHLTFAVIALTALATAGVPAVNAVGLVAAVCSITYLASRSRNVKSAFTRMGMSFMAIVNPADLTFTPDEIRDISEAIIEEAFKNPNPSDINEIYTGI